ncbi:MAG: hypothetical protein JNM89_04890 [Hyphomicrobiaceae bacterium]|nr:hypothetical protein [Hyphomicrobiaceae bacterium]
MRKDIYFDNFFGPGWPDINELEPYFLAPKGKEWFYTGGNDSGSLRIEGIDGTEHLHRLKGRKDIKLSMYGNPELGVLMQYSLVGGAPRQDWFSKGDMSKLKTWVRSLHDTPLPIGLFIPFAEAWKAVKEFMETEGQFPKSIEWIKGANLPEGTFPDP